MFLNSFNINDHSQKDLMHERDLKYKFEKFAKKQLRIKRGMRREESIEIFKYEINYWIRQGMEAW